MKDACRRVLEHFRHKRRLNSPNFFIFCPHANDFHDAFFVARDAFGVDAPEVHFFAIMYDGADTFPPRTSKFLDRPLIVIMVVSQPVRIFLQVAAGIGSSRSVCDLEDKKSWPWP